MRPVVRRYDRHLRLVPELLSAQGAGLAPMEPHSLYGGGNYAVAKQSRSGRMANERSGSQLRVRFTVCSFGISLRDTLRIAVIRIRQLAVTDCRLVHFLLIPTVSL